MPELFVYVAEMAQAYRYAIKGLARAKARARRIPQRAAAGKARQKIRIDALALEIKKQHQQNARRDKARHHDGREQILHRPQHHRQKGQRGHHSVDGARRRAELLYITYHQQQTARHQQRIQQPVVRTAHICARRVQIKQPTCERVCEHHRQCGGQHDAEAYGNAREARAAAVDEIGHIVGERGFQQRKERKIQHIERVAKPARQQARHAHQHHCGDIEQSGKKRKTQTRIV